VIAPASCALCSKFSNFQGWRTSFFDPELNAQIDAAQVEADPEKQVAMYQGIQVRLEEVVPSSATSCATTSAPRFSGSHRSPTSPG
jgi:ABC-type transport system substrate-binding protein